MIASNSGTTLTGRQFWERTATEHPWELACLQWFKPRPGITKVANYLAPDGSLKLQQAYLVGQNLPSFSPRSRLYDTQGQLIFTMETCVIQPTQGADAPIGSKVRYLRPDGRRICELEISQATFAVRYYGEADRLLSERTEPQTGEIEFFERDGRNITFEAFTSIKDEAGNLIERRSSTPLWKYTTSEDGRPIMRMYKNGLFQRDRYIEQLYEPISFALLFEDAGSR